MKNKIINSARKLTVADMHALLDTLPFLFWIKDKESRFILCNHAFAHHFHQDPDELKGKTDFDLHPEFAEGYVADDRDVMENNQAKTIIERIRKKNEEPYWAETFKAPFVVDGVLVGTVGFARDISRFKYLQDAVLKGQLDYTTLAESLPMTVLRYDLECRRTFVSPYKHGDYKLADNLELYKSPAEQWSGDIKNISGQEYAKLINKAIETGLQQSTEIIIETTDGHYVNQVKIVPEYDEHRKIVGALATISDITELADHRKKIEHLAYHDPLTSLPNRTLLNLRLQHAIDHAGKQQNNFGLLFIDLDYFKSINDTLGHAIGDQLLIEAGKRILSCVRAGDLVARIGGDEFAILVLDIHHDADLAGFAAKIATKFAEPFNIESLNFFVTVSTGIACYPRDSDNIDDLMKYADTAMYQAKKLGRNNFHFYTSELTQNVAEHLAITTALRYAVKKNELSLHYQPKVCIETGTILGAEALLRWNCKVLGNVTPDRFIPIAEESGLIDEIGDWVLRNACEMAASINKDRAEPITIAINISSKQFVGKHFFEFLQHTIKETGCEPRWINLEITESLLLRDSDDVLHILNAIDAMGIKVAIDDFGTGYSALAYLNKFPIRQVKIDRSFVNDICDQESAAALVKAIVAMAQSLNKELVAEGIETKAQAKLLKSYGCHLAQGYFFSHPVPLPAFMELVKKRVIKIY